MMMMATILTMAYIKKEKKERKNVGLFWEKLKE